MTKTEAVALIEAAKAGEPVTREQMTQALWATGDARPIVRREPPALPSQRLKFEWPACSSRHRFGYQPNPDRREALRNERLERNLLILGGYYVLKPKRKEKDFE